MLARYCGPGLMGLGVTALVAGFMAEWLATVSAFATVDLRHLPSVSAKRATDQHYVSHGRWCTIIAYLSASARRIWRWVCEHLDYVQALSVSHRASFRTVLLACCGNARRRWAGSWVAGWNADGDWPFSLP